MWGMVVDSGEKWGLGFGSVEKPTTGSEQSDGKEQCDMFVGVHERQLDPKGRVALPAAFRPRLEPRCYLALGADKCVDILTAEAFEQVASDMMEKVRRGEVDRTQQRALAASAVEVTIDAQGRINIDEKLRTYAGLTLDSKVVISGSFDRCEIWDPTRHQRVSEAGTAQMAGGAS
jgi:MraZ protein